MPKAYTDSAMSAAVADVKFHNLSIRKAAEKYKVPKSSLSDRITGKIPEGASWGKKPMFTENEESEMVDVAIKRANMGIGFSKPNFFRFAGAVAKAKGVALKSGRPSDMWWRRMKKRHPEFSLRSPEATSTVRHNAMSRDRLNRYFKALGEIVLSPNFHDQPSKIWNMDETGINLAHKPTKVIAKKGIKTLHGKTSSSRELITVIACANASGGFLPPHFVFPGKTKRKLESYDFEVATTQTSPIRGANFSVSDSGWTKDGIARLWFTNTFLRNIGPSRPQLLICDGHGSHNNVEFLELAKENDIIVVELPSHTSQWTQPLDRSVFKSLKCHWNTTVDNFIRETGVSVGNKQFLKLFSVAWQKSFMPSTIRNGFAATGIYPFNSDVIPNEAYAPNLCVESGHPETFISTAISSGATTGSESVVTDEIAELASLQTEDECHLECHLAQEEEPLLDLLCASTPCLDDSNEITTCSNRDALAIIESTLTHDQKLMFSAALISGGKTKLDQDPLYQSWKHYTQLLSADDVPPTTLTTDKQTVLEKSPTEFARNATSAQDVADDIFPIPRPVSTQSTKKRANEYFVLTADEILIQKRQAVELKAQVAAIREKKRKEREEKKMEKLKKKAIVQNRKKGSATTNKNLIDML